MTNKKKTKIIATVGPATESLSMIEKMANSGANVFRLNFSHDSYNNHSQRIKNIRKVESKINKPLAVLQDLQGPKMRIGDIPGNEIDLIKNKQAIFTVSVPRENEIPVQYKKIINEIEPGHRILLDDGTKEVKVINKKYPLIYTKVIHGGKLSSRKGMNFPDTKINCTVFTTKDKQDLEFGLKNDIDYVAMSFVSSATDIRAIKNFVLKKGKSVKIVAKIERHEALENLEEIIEVADAIMVARGDLGIEVSLDKVPLIQKEIIKKCISQAKPVIVATQMLNTMIKEPNPTRAEVSDIANAILDGADAVMLSGETSVGQFPIKAIKTMKDIAVKTESWAIDQLLRIGKDSLDEIKNTTSAIGKSACDLIYELKAKLIINATATGNTSRAIARYRPYAPIVSVTHDKKTARELQLVWGVYARKLDYKTIDEMVKQALKAVYLGRIVKKGDKVVVLAGERVGISGITNTIQIKTI